MNTLPLSQSSNGNSGHILVVDDAYENLCFVQTVLESDGYRVSLAENGKEALEKIETEAPELVLSDVMMPGIDGIELTRKIREQTELPFIPILLITAQEQSDVVAGLDAGADDFIRKPVEVPELVARVRSLLRLKHSIDEREQMAFMREEFVYRLTHDLRIPLVAADRMFTLLKRNKYGQLSEKAQSILSSMKDSNHDLLQMTNNLLEIYRYEAGQKSVPHTRFSLLKLAQSVVDELQPLAEEKGITLELKNAATQKDDDFKLSAARVELRRVLTNLVGNSIKFTDTGSVAVQFKQTTDEIKITVADTGCGISPAEQPIVFERAFQGSHRYSGSGLGLNLVRQIVEAHQGKVTVDSELGKGSTFTVCLPTNS